MKLNQLRKLIREEIQRTQKNENVSDQIRDYWEIMVNNQPEDVIDILIKLTSGGVTSYNAFISSTEADIYDSLGRGDYDSSIDDDDEDMDDDDF
jgi:hypothetical protein